MVLREDFMSGWNVDGCTRGEGNLSQEDGRGSTDVEARTLGHLIRVLELQIGPHAILLRPSE